MPLYEYQCGSCGNRFELLRRIKDADDDVECPNCHCKRVERLFSTFAGAKCSASSSGGFT